MVGDVKQSIYRFRNANPDIFRDKYNNYSINNGGIKIDLLKNFRSREEVIENINLIFNQIMDDALGGADYIKTHQMVFGNTSYNEDGHTGNNNHLEIYKYDADKKYLKEEIEAFIIAHDIKNKVDNKYLIYDKDEKLIRPIQYSDICIIMDRGSSFDIYKEIFGYMQIPLVIYADNKLTNEYDILTLKNIINFIIKISKHEYDTLFKYYFVSISRSFIMNLKDDEIYKIIKENKIKDTDLYKWSYEISSVLDTISNNELIDMIIDKFNVYDRLITLGDVHKSMIRIENLKGIASSLETLGYTPFDFGDYLNQMIDNKVDIKYSTSTDSGDSVKIMNIHKSKGLEFNICYFSGLYKAFNISDLKERFCFDSKYGIITPYYKEGIGSTILKDLQKNKYMLDEISERIRLFYVALTRCKEKMIMILPNVEEEENNNYGGNIVDSRIRIKYRSFADMLNSINSSLSNYVKNIDINDIQITKNYKIRNEKDLKISNFDVDNKGTKVTFTENIVDFKKIEERHASKTITELITKKEHDNMKYGTYMHELLETVDFYNPVVPSEYKTRINNFIKQIDLENVKIYKEHEFIFEYKNCEYHGIIDLLLEYDDKFVIIDYKLKEVSDKNYLKQLEVYKNYLKSISNKQVFTYLYSIIDSRLVKID
jgi:ATP-dependent helicase/nuclease subunit A